MADDTNIKIDELNDLLDRIETTKARLEGLAGQSTERIRQAGDLIGGIYREILEGIDKAYGKQAEFLSASELGTEVQLRLIQKQKEERAKLIQLQQKQLGIIESLADAQRDLDTTSEQLATNEAKRLQLAQELAIEENKQAADTAKIAKLKQNISKSEKEQQSIINRQSTAQAKVTTLTERAVRNGIEENDVKNKTTQELESLVGVQKAAIKSQERLTKETEKTGDALKEAQERQKNNNSIIDNTIAKFTGLKSVTGGFVELLLDAGGDQKKLNELSGQFTERLKMAAHPINIIANVLSKISSIITDVTNKVNGMTVGIKSLATDIIESPITFRRDTGLVRELGMQLRDLKTNSAGAGFNINETDVAFRGLAKSMVSFTRMGSSTREFLTGQARLYQRAGLSAENYGKSIEALNKTMGMSATEADSLTNEIIAFGEVVGIDAGTAVTDFTKNLDLLATYGKDKGVTIFKNLAAAANEAGVQIETLNQIANKFETFDSAMNSANKLNFILKGPFLNSMKLLQATPDETLKILREGFDKAGKSFDSFGRRGREAIAKTLGVGVDVAKRLFDDRSLKNAKDLEKSLMERARAAKSINDESLRELTLQQKQELMYEKVLQILMPLADRMNALFNQFYDFMNSETGTIIITTLTGIGNAISYLLPLFAVLIGPTAIGGLITQMGKMAGVGTTTITTIGKITGAVTALAGAYYALTAAQNQQMELDKQYRAGKISQKEYKERSARTKSGAQISTALSGVGAGAAIGSMILPGVGTLIGAGIGGIAGYVGAGAMLNEGTKNFKPGNNMRPAGKAVGAAFMGDAAGGVMTPYTEAAMLPTGTSVLTSDDVAALTGAVRAMPNIVEMMADAITDSVNKAIEVTTQQKEDGNENLTLNLVIKMNEGEIASVARRVSMDTMRRGLEIVT